MYQIINVYVEITNNSLNCKNGCFTLSIFECYEVAKQIMKDILHDSCE